MPVSELLAPLKSRIAAKRRMNRELNAHFHQLADKVLLFYDQFNTYFHLDYPFKAQPISAEVFKIC